MAQPPPSSAKPVTPAHASVWRDTRPCPRKIARWLVVHGGLIVALVGFAPAWRWDGLLWLAGSVYVTMGLGVSVGLHRGVVHQSFAMSAGLRAALLYASTLPAIGGPITLARMHRSRDVFQKQPVCPHFFGYRLDPARSYLMQMFCAYTGPQPEDDAATAALEADPWARLLEQTWPLQQAVFALAVWALGGWSAVFWAVLVRVVLCQNMVWWVNYAAHTRGALDYPQPGCAEQGRNHPVWGVLSFGEGWHNNHHAFPRSARMGLRWWQVDLGYASVCVLEALGLVWDVQRATPALEEVSAGVEEATGGGEAGAQK